MGHLLTSLLQLMQADIRLNMEALQQLPAATTLLRTQYAAIYTAVMERKAMAARAAVENHLDFMRESMAQSLRTLTRRASAERRFQGRVR